MLFRLKSVSSGPSLRCPIGPQSIGVPIASSSSNGLVQHNAMLRRSGASRRLRSSGELAGTAVHGTFRPLTSSCPAPFDLVVESDESLTLTDQLKFGRSIG